MVIVLMTRVHPKYAHTSCFAVFHCGAGQFNPRPTMLLRIAPERYDCHGAGKATLEDMGKYIISMHQKNCYNQNKTNHKSVPDSKVHGANMGPIWGR